MTWRPSVWTSTQWMAEISIPARSATARISARRPAGMSVTERANVKGAISTASYPAFRAKAKVSAKVQP